jgi:CDP-paratose 2-epimerase
MWLKKLVVTGSNGLIGSEVVKQFCQQGWNVYGIDNNMRAEFFGKHGDTLWNQKQLLSTFNNFKHKELDIRNQNRILSFVSKIRPNAIVHAAAQPSHDLAAKYPFDDFDVNARGTLNLLEAVRQFCPESPFVYLSTNKVYGDAPNKLQLIEKKARWDYIDQEYYNGINESFSVDQTLHSLFGVSKLAGDIYVQEYGRYFNMPTCCLRCGCLTGPNHSGVELHGFLSYLIKCNIQGIKYTIYGYKGKQVRDNIHSYDVVRFIEAFIDSPRKAEVYNIGGGRDNSVSIIEAFNIIESISGRRMISEYIEDNRKGDHICYISDLTKTIKHYSKWHISKDLPTIFMEIYESWITRQPIRENNI